MKTLKKMLALTLCFALLATVSLSAAAAGVTAVTLAFDTVEEQDFVEVHLNVKEKNSMIGAFQAQFDYDETYLEIVPLVNPSNPKNLFFDCPYTYEEHKVLYASNEKNMKFALATSKGIQDDGLFVTIRFRVIRDIPAGQLAEISGIIEVISDCNGDQYQSAVILSGGVMGTDYLPDNNHYTNERTGIEAITGGEDAINKGDFVTRFHGTDGQAVDYDIGFLDGEEALQPEDDVTVRLPLPENFDPKAVQVFHEDEKGNKTEMTIIVREDTIILETNGFSRYTVVDPTKQAGEYLEAPQLSYGDLDGNKKVDAKDALVVLKVAVKKITPDADQRKAAKVNKDDKIDAKDALEILKYAVKKIEKFPAEQA